jgi:hypothetical protein
MHQHHPSLVLPRASVRYPPDSVEDLLLTEYPGQPWSLLLPISSSSWNSSPLLSTTQQRNEIYPPTVDDQVSLRLTWVHHECLNILALTQGNAVGNMYNSLLSGHSPNHRPTLYLSDEVRTISVILSNINDWIQELSDQNTPIFIQSSRRSTALFSTFRSYRHGSIS